MIALTLPYPPSANRYWRNYRGVTVKSDEARIYQNHAGWLAKTAGYEMLTCDVEVTLRVYRPRKAGDLDNRIKVMLDTLRGIIYVDDEQVIKIVAERFDDKGNPRVELEVKERRE